MCQTKSQAETEMCQTKSQVGLGCTKIYHKLEMGFAKFSDWAVQNLFTLSTKQTIKSENKQMISNFWIFIHHVFYKWQ